MQRLTKTTIWAFLAIFILTTAVDACHRRKRGCHSSCHDSCVSHVDAHGNHVSSDGRTSYYPQQRTGEPIPAPGRNLDGQSRTGARLDFVAPTDAQIWVDGRLVERTGNQYYYEVPAFQTGQRRNYQVKARWTDNGREVNQSRTVNVDSAGRINVDFTRPELRK